MRRIAGGGGGGRGQKQGDQGGGGGSNPVTADGACPSRWGWCLDVTCRRSTSRTSWPQYKTTFNAEQMHFAKRAMSFRYKVFF